MFGKTQIGGVKSEGNLVLISVLAMPSRLGTAGKLMTAMGAHNLNVEFIAQMIGIAGNDNVVFCVKEDLADEAMQVVEAMQNDLQAQGISRRDGVGLVFTFGPEFRHMPGVAGQIFQLLGDAGINIRAISTSMAAVTCVIDSDRVAEAEQVLGAVFATP
jgi:aspartate kinase